MPDKKYLSTFGNLKNLYSFVVNNRQGVCFSKQFVA